MPKGMATPASWTPGKSGNPSGRPKGPIPLTQAIREIGERDGNWKKAAEVLWDMAVTDRNIKAFALIFDRAEGKARQFIEISADSGGKGVADILLNMVVQNARPQQPTVGSSEPADTYEGSDEDI